MNEQPAGIVSFGGHDVYGKFGLVLVVFWLAIAGFPGTVFAGKPDRSLTRYAYVERIGNTRRPFHWEKRELGELAEIRVWDRDTEFFNRCRIVDGTTVYYRLIDRKKGHNLEVWRKGNTIVLRGRRNSAAYEETVSIDSRPWLQPLSYSLGPFLRSGKTRLSYWTVRADSAELIVLEATRKGTVHVALSTGAESVTKEIAEKVEVRPEGIFSAFWHGTYWFRKRDQLFLRYSAVHGFPGTPETVVELLGLEEN